MSKSRTQKKSTKDNSKSQKKSKTEVQGVLFPEDEQLVAQEAPKPEPIDLPEVESAPFDPSKHSRMPIPPNFCASATIKDISGLFSLAVSTSPWLRSPLYWAEGDAGRDAIFMNALTLLNSEEWLSYVGPTIRYLFRGDMSDKRAITQTYTLLALIEGLQIRATDLEHTVVDVETFPAPGKVSAETKES